jgi:hypothetical protein
MLKAAAGGGGKGMRQVAGESELQSALEAAQSEAASAFGNSEVYLEKVVEKPRHIEFKSSPTSTETLFISASVSARSSGAIRRSLKSVLLQSTMPDFVNEWRSGNKNCEGR